MSRTRRIAVRSSPIHGRGVFALRPLDAGERVIAYAGEVIPWEEAVRRHQDRPGEDSHTMFFDLGDGDVIDGWVGGNSSRWINHSCDPNCETRQTEGSIEILALRGIAAGEELTFDYRLVLDDEDGDDGTYACACGSARCRGTMLDV
ncbi:MAG: SET domain-containing protein [Thermoleophilia bacterium]